MISIKSDIKAITKQLNNIQKKQIPFAVSKALNATAFKAHEKVKEQLPNYIDRPTPFTVKGIRYKKSTKRNLEARVFIMENRAKYLKKFIGTGKYFTIPDGIGGGRERNRKNYLVPTKNMMLNKYGNIPKSKLKTLIGDPNADLQGHRYFKGIPKGRYGEHFYGVWERYAHNKRLKKVLTVSRGIKSKVYFPFQEIVKNSVKKNFKKEFQKSLSHAIRTAK